MPGLLDGVAMNHSIRRASTALGLAIAMLASSVVFITLACSEELPICGNETELWFHEVIQEQGCADCMEFDFSSRIFLEDNFRVRDRPDYVLSRCGISEIYAATDAVTLVLSPEADASLFEFRRKLTDRSKNASVLIRLPDRKSPVTVKYAADLRRVLMLFDVGSAVQIERFVAELRPGVTVVKQNDQGLLSKEPRERKISAEGKALLRELDETVPLLEELQSALDSGADDDEVQNLLDRIEKVRSHE